MSRMEQRRAATVTTALLGRQPERFGFFLFQFDLMCFFLIGILVKCAGFSKKRKKNFPGAKTARAASLPLERFSILGMGRH